MIYIELELYHGKPVLSEIRTDMPIPPVVRVNTAYLKAIIAEQLYYPIPFADDYAWRQSLRRLTGSTFDSYKPSAFGLTELEELIKNILYSSKESLLKHFPIVLSRFQHNEILS